MKYNILLFFILVASLSFAQQKEIRGTITSKSDGAPIPGVSVVVAGTTSGTVTDFDGNYTLHAKSGDVLQFSFIGMLATDVTVGNNAVINVQLEEDVSQLEEVVITALGIKKSKKAIGYAVSDINNEELELGKEPNVVNSLLGKVAGVEINQTAAGVGSSNRLILRGNSSITGSNQVLYVVDGIPINNTENEGNIDEWGNGVSIGNGIADISPDDVENISVLKGANASALYGARAANGVVMITTKKGKAGKISIGFNSAITIDKVAYLPDFQNSYGQGSYGNIPDDGSLKNFSSWGPKLDGSQQLLWTGENGVYGANPNNIKDFFNSGITAINSFYVEGGSKTVSSRLSYSRSDISGIVPNNELTRNYFSLYSKLTQGKFSAEMKANYVNQEVENRPYLSIWPDNIINSLYTMPRNVNLTDLKANLDMIPLTGAYNNPFHTVNKVGSVDNKNRVFGFGLAKYAFTDELNLMIRAGSDYSTQTFLSYSPVGHPTIPGGRVTDHTYTNQETNLDFLISYNKQLNDNLNIALSFGGNQLKGESYIKGGTGNGLRSPGIYNILNTESYISNSGTGVSKRRVNSLYGTMDLNYKSFLFAQVTARNDWSSVLPLNNNSYFYPSVSLSGIISDMLNFESDTINYLKLRASWAEVGGDGQIPAYSIHSRYLTGAPYLGKGTITTPSLKPNSNIKPQTTKSLEFGAETRLFNNRLAFNLSIYDAETIDQIIYLPAPVESGYTEFLENFGTVTNSGLELELDYKLVRKDAIKWNLGLNYANNKTEVSNLPTDIVPLAPITGNTPFRILAYNNGNYGDIVGFGYKRNDKGQILVNDAGIPFRSKEQKTFGNFNPDLILGLTNSIKYKNFNLGFLISSKIGGQILSRTDMILDANGNSKRTLINRESGNIVVPNSIIESSGLDNNVAAPIQEYYATIAGEGIIEDYVYDADYIKLKELSFGYTFPTHFLDNLNVSEISIRFIARNLFFFHRNTDSFDPEVSGYNTRNAQGVELLSLPGTRSYGVNLSVKL